MKQVWINLLLNGAQSMDGAEVDGERALELGTGRADGERGELVAWVRDRGRGIPEDDLPHVFEPFFTTRPEGTGLGMPTARKIIEAHGGRIDVESEPGRGTTIRVALPLGRVPA